MMMTCKFYRVVMAACAFTLASQGAALSTKTGIGSSATDDKTNSSASPIRIPKLPPFAGVTLSGMDFASNSSTNPIAANLTTLLVPHAPLVNHSLPTADPFTLPDFEQAIHYLEDRHVGSIKLPLSWESLQRNITRMEVYTDVVATVTSRNASAIVTLSISPEHFSNFTTLPKGGEKTSHKNEHKNGPLIQDDAASSFVDLWGKLAEHFQHDRRVIFHLLAIPKGSILPKNWNQTVQAAVTNIRKNGASNVIILPSFVAPDGTTFDSFRDFPKDFARMRHVKNPDGTTHGIVFDLAQTLGPKGPASQRCRGVDVPKIIDPVVKLLKEHRRQAVVGTLAAASDPTCTRTLAKFAKQISSSYPALAGFVMYGAGAYDQNSPWALIKEKPQDASHCSAESADELVDQPNFQSVQPFFPKKNGSAQKKPTL